MSTWIRWALTGQLVVVLAGWCAPLWAAEITRRDGSVVRGEIVLEDDSKVVVQVSRAGMSMKVTITREEISNIDRTAAAPPATTTNTTATTVKPGAAGEPAAPAVVKHAGPVYYRIPLEGKVGMTFVASILDKSLSDAALRSPSAVVLEIDSPGGLIQEVDKLVEVIAKHKKKLRIVVWTRHAISAAAITAMCVDEIYVDKGATFGAATAYRMTPEGTPDNINEKMQSVWRARGRAAAEMGNHSPLLAEAMIDGSKRLYLGTSGGKPAVLAEEATGAVVLKDRGKLLTLTAQEAVRCGLAKAVVESHAELGKAMGFAGWTECEGLGVALAAWWSKRVETATKDWQTTVARLDDAFRQARAADPSTFNDYHDNDMESVRKWNERSTRCANALRVAENSLTNMARLAEEYPHMMVNKELVDASRRHLAEIRARIESGRVRVQRR